MSVHQRLASITADNIQPTTPKYAWAGRIPLGAVSVLAGPPGQGKTQLAVGMCSRATRGRLEGDLSRPAEVLYVSAEDSLEHTLTPRAIAAGADLKRFHFLEGIHTDTHRGEEQRHGMLIPDDLRLLDQWLEEHPARIVVLDPIVALIPSNLNAHRDQHVRRALAPLAQIATSRNTAVVAIMHLNKDREADALNRLSGSIGFGGAARSVLLFAQDPDDPEGESGSRRILAHVKCNVGPRQDSIAYRIEPKTIEAGNGDVKTSIAVRDGNARLSANDLLANPTSSSEASVRTEAREFLLAELADGPVASAELKARAEDASVSWRTIERVKSQLGIQSRKTGSTWRWQLPTPPNTPVGGLVGLGGDEQSKTANTANAAGKKNVADFDPDAEHARLVDAYPDIA